MWSDEGRAFGTLVSGIAHDARNAHWNLQVGGGLAWGPRGEGLGLCFQGKLSVCPYACALLSTSCCLLKCRVRVEPSGLQSERPAG
jgi:hypothetical protein